MIRSGCDIMFEIEKIKDKLREKLSEYRYGHSLRVAEEAKRLAKVYSIDEEKAYLAGLIHDVAKEFSDEENIKWIREGDLSLDLLDGEFDRVIHSEIGSVVVKEWFNVDEEIQQAVRYHTVGNIGMTLLDKIVFVADKIESGKKYPGIEEERVLAYQNIDKALWLCLKNQKDKKELEGKRIHPDSLELLGWLEKDNIYS